MRVPLHITVEVLAAFALCLCGKRLASTANLDLTKEYTRQTLLPAAGSLGLAGSFKPISPFANQR